MLRQVALASSSAFLLSLSGRPWASPYFALFALVPALHALQGERGIWRGALVSYIVALPVFVVGFEGLVVKAPLAFYGLVFVLSTGFILPGIVIALAQRGSDHPVYLYLFALSWVSVETLAGSFTLWHNWANPLSIGLSQAASPLARLAYWGGVPLIALFVLTFNVALFQVGRHRGPLVIVTGLMAFLIVFPSVQRGESVAGAEQNLTIGIVQGRQTDVELASAGFSIHEQERITNRYLDLTEKLRAEHPDVDLVVWPEAALAFHTRYLEKFLDHKEIFPKDLPVLTGAYNYQPRQDHLYMNSALFWDGQAYRFVYDKQALVPMYEDLFRSGEGYADGLVTVENVRVGLGICWESLYPELARNSVKMGADLLVYLSDDTFAGASVTPWYHMRVSAIRAIESGRHVVFASQAGPSAVFTPSGNEVLITERDQAGYWVTAVEVGPGGASTPFTKFGNWVGYASFLLTLGAVGWMSRHSSPSSAEFTFY